MSEDLKPGDFVTKTVQLVRPIGQGGMGTVWLADHLQLDTRVVVKVMAHGLEHRADILARFAREAMICAQVKSPHVVQVFDTGTTDGGHPYIVMEFLEGHDLGKHLAEHGPMMPGALVPIVVQLAKALARAHRAGIVHRDIKPENVFLCENEASNDPFVKLLDFGTAKVELPSHRDMTSTDTGQVLGTPLYMSPEQILGEKEIDHRSDIWSLGVVVFEALTGETPFEGATIAALALAIHDATPRLSDVVPEMPEAIDAWFGVSAGGFVPAGHIVAVAGFFAGAPRPISRTCAAHRIAHRFIHAIKRIERLGRFFLKLQ
jgi:serine/threonine-protein kinase